MAACYCPALLVMCVAGLLEDLGPYPAGKQKVKKRAAAAARAAPAAHAVYLPAWAVCVCVCVFFVCVLRREFQLTPGLLSCCATRVQQLTFRGASV